MILVITLSLYIKDFKLGFWKKPFVLFMIPMVFLLIIELIFYINLPLIIVKIFVYLTAYKIAELTTGNFHKYIDRKLHEYIYKHSKKQQNI